jgi:hypothetical protein
MLMLVTAAAGGAGASAQAPRERALDLVSGEFLWKSRYQYIMGGKVRLLLFWVGKDDVGGGYVLLGQRAKTPSLEAIKLVFGSSPEKAPRRINLWGVASEVVERDPQDGSPRASAFLGFRKRSDDEMRERTNAIRLSEETEGEKARGFFGASLNYIDSEIAFARTARFSTERDFELGELEEVERTVVSGIAGVEAEERWLGAEGRAACARVPGFLGTLEEMVEEIVRERPSLIHRCYIYNARRYTMSLTRLAPVARHQVRIERVGGEKLERTYNDLLQARFQVLNHDTGEKTAFTLLLGTSAPIDGVPVRVVYQPSWWIQVFLNLESIAFGDVDSHPASHQ